MNKMSLSHFIQILLIVMAAVQAGGASDPAKGEEGRNKGFVLSDFNK